MEKSENRIKFMARFGDVLQKFNLSGNDLQNFLQTLVGHPYFKFYAAPLQDLNGDERAQKVFILTEFTKERFTCNVLIQMFRKETLLDKLGELLEEFNTSPGLMKLSTEVEIPIAIGLNMFHGMSNNYPICNYPRGTCVIINNVEDTQTLPYFDLNLKKWRGTVGLLRETQRLKYIFESLYFRVKILTNLNVNQIKHKLEHIRNEVKEEDNGFILIVLSHGKMRTVYGSYACYAIQANRFGLLRQNDPRYQEALDTDQIRIGNLVSMFSETNCPQLKNKPKLHFFIVCRVNDENINQMPAVLDSNKSKDSAFIESVPMDVSEITDDQGNRNLLRDTFVCFPCSRGFETFFNRFYGMTYFGQAFTHSIAQFACDESLTEIMSRTIQHLDKMFKEQNIDPKFEGSYAIQFNNFSMSRALYFNPGYH